MAIDFRTIFGAMGRETTERAMHKFVSDRIHDEIAKGKNARNVVIDFLIGIRDSTFLQAVRGIFGTHATGLALTGLGAGFAKYLQQLDWGLIGVDDSSPVMREVRFILQNVMPSLLVGGAEGLSDTFDQDVIDAVGKVRSDDTLDPSTQQKGEFDEVYRISPACGVDDLKDYGLLFAEGIDPATGKLRVDHIGSVILRGENGRRFMKDWYATHKEREVEYEEPNDKKDKAGNPLPPYKKKKKVPSEPYYGFLQPLTRAIAEMPVSAAPTDPDILQQILDAHNVKKDEPKKEEPVKSEMEKLTEAGEAFTVSAANSIHLLNPLHRKLFLDWLQDVTKASSINLLGKKFVAGPDGVFTIEQMRAIENYVQLWFRAKLDFGSKLRLAAEQAKLMLEGGDNVMQIAWKVTKIIGGVAAGAALIVTGLFVLLAALFFYAAFFMDTLTTANFTYTPMLIGKAWTITKIACGVMVLKTLYNMISWGTSSWRKEAKQALVFVLGGAAFMGTAYLWDEHLANYFTITTNRPEVAGLIIMVTSLLLILELLLITPLEAALSWIKTFKEDLEDDWLKNKGRITIMFIGLHAGVLMFLIADESSRMTRLMVCGAATLIAIAVQMGLVAYGFPNSARVRSKRTLGWFGIISLVFFAGGVLIHVLARNGLKPYGLLSLAMSNIWFMTLVIFAAVAFAIFKIILMGEATFRDKSTGDVLYSDKPNMPLRVIALVLALATAGWYYYVKNEEAKKAPSNPVASAISLLFAPQPAPTPAPGSPTVPPQAAAAPIVPQAYPVTTSVPAPTAPKHKRNSPQSSSEDPCEGYDETLRSQLVGCK